MMIEFKDRGRSGDQSRAYAYKVLRPIYEAIVNAESPGRAFNTLVRKGGWYRRIS
jgi:hypothetical protein